MAIGGIIRGSKKITSNYTIVERDEIIYVDTSGGDITLTLARPTNDNIVYIKKVASANTVTILTEESKTIDGESSKTLSDNNSFLKLAYFVDESENEFKIIGQSSTSLGYSSYVAKITQESTSDPTAVITKNDLGGSGAWTRTDVGEYLFTLSGAFPTDSKIYVFQGAKEPTFRMGYTYQNANAIQIFVQDTTTGSEQDDTLTNTPIEIRVYN